MMTATLLALAGMAPVGTIEIAVAGVRSAQGRVHVDVCPEAQFLKDCAFSGEAQARIGTTIVTIRNVPPGRYAVQASHDRNGNGKVDRGLFGIPTEGVGFSNDAPIRMGPPRFSDAAFAHGPVDQRIALTLRFEPAH